MNDTLDALPPDVRALVDRLGSFGRLNDGDRSLACREAADALLVAYREVSYEQGKKREAMDARAAAERETERLREALAEAGRWLREPGGLNAGVGDPLIRARGVIDAAIAASREDQLPFDIREGPNGELHVASRADQRNPLIELLHFLWARDSLAASREDQPCACGHAWSEHSPSGCMVRLDVEVWCSCLAASRESQS